VCLEFQLLQQELHRLAQHMQVPADDCCHSLQQQPLNVHGVAVQLQLQRPPWLGIVQHLHGAVAANAHLDSRQAADITQRAAAGAGRRLRRLLLLATAAAVLQRCARQQHGHALPVAHADAGGELLRALQP
jgi:hypothetical protein